MHAKSAEVTQFLDRDLLPQVAQAFGLYKTADKAELEKELATSIAQAQALGADPETLPKVKELRYKLANEAVDLSALESEVYDHLFSFFRRYYSEGDFLAKRVYKPGVYAIPYEGEEVTLYWANRDQYYIKTSEYLRDYAFRLRPDDSVDPMRVHFRLVDAAEGEHGNVKTAEGKDRVFILAPAGESGRDFITEFEGEQGKELNIGFEYRPATLADWPDEIRGAKKNPPAQKDLREIAAKRLLTVADPSISSWIAELAKPYKNGNGGQAEYSRVEAHLVRYVACNTFDYFIHKDLGRFLRGELDFYIKNEVMHLDDVESETAPRVEQYLSKIKTIRSIAGKIISFVAQLEDFEKKLWLKRKFITQTQYCCTLFNVAEEFYAEIAANDSQREEWVRLLAIDEIAENLTTPGYSVPLTVEFLKAYPTLMIDTLHFPEAFNSRLIDSIDNMSKNTEGLLIHGENFQSLNCLKNSLQKTVDFVYIDPPYNTDATEIIYKNGYKESSWLALIDSRLNIGHSLLRDNGVHCLTIDDYEHAKARLLLDEEFRSDNYLATVLIRNNPSGRSTVKGFSVNHEFALFYANDASATEVGRLPHTEEQKSRYDDQAGDRSFEWENFRKSSAGSDRASRPKQHFPLFLNKDDDSLRIPNLNWVEGTKSYAVLEDPRPNEMILLPIDELGTEKVWRWGLKRTRLEIGTLIVKSVNGRIEVYGKKYLNEDGVLPRTWWDKAGYSARDNGTRTLRDMFGRDVPFEFPKAVEAVMDCIRIGCPSEEGLVLDYFGGSGTTGHAVVRLNREADTRRRFVIAEMGAHFDTVLLPRMKKVVFTPDWKDGKPERHATSEEAERSPNLIKVIRIESYEDALNNLETRRSPSQQSLLDAHDAQGAGGFREQFLLRYMLDVESRGSHSLLNVQAFQDPTSYRLRVKRPGSDESSEVTVDLLETFNWLIGLTVKHIAAPQEFSAEFERDTEKRLRVKGRIKQEVAGPWWFRTVMGTTPDGRRTLIIWRKLTGKPEQDNLVLDEWFTKQGYSTRDYEFQLIYVNGDSNLENLKTPDDTWKVRLIEEDFHRLMFDTEGV
jgi:adenine-specific DNA-methyltransferase